MRRQWRQWWPAITVVLLIAAVVVVCLMGSSAAGAPLMSRRGAAAGRVLVARGSIDGAYPARGALFVALRRGSSGEDSLVRLAPGGGPALARRGLGESYDDGLEFDGSLWVLTTAYTRTTSSSELWRLDPGTLAVRATLPLPGSQGALNLRQSIAVAGRRLWIAYGDHLALLDPRTDAFGSTRRVAGARDLGVLADRSAGILLVSAADERGGGWLQERTLLTGALLRATAHFGSVTPPRLGGVAAGALWASASTGMMDFAERVSLRTLRPLRTPAVPRFVTNAIEARVAGGALFISQYVGGATRNYCGSPVTGAPRAALPRSLRTGELLDVDAHRILYLGPSSERAPDGPLMSVPVPVPCR